MWRLLLVIERDSGLLVEVECESTDDGIDVAISTGVGLEPIPPRDKSQWEGRFVVDQLKWLDRGEPGNQATGAVSFDAWVGECVRPAFRRILTGVPLSSGRKPRIAYSDEYSGSGAGHRDADRPNLRWSAVGKRAARRSDVCPAAQRERLDDLVVRRAERRQRQSRSVVLETIDFARGIAWPVHDRRVNLTQLVGEAQSRCYAGVRGREKSRALHRARGKPARPELLDVIDDDVVQEAAADVGVPARALDEIVLQISVFRSDHPTAIKGVLGSRGLLKNVGGDTNACPIAGGHSESEIRPLQIELVGRVGHAFVAAVLGLCVKHAWK